MTVQGSRRPEGVPLDQWEGENQPYDRQIGYRDGFWRQILFVRNHIHPIFVPTGLREENPVLVVGTHSDNSSVLPVYCIVVPGLVLRFALPALSWVGWRVSVLAERDVVGLPPQPTTLWLPVPDFEEGLHAFRPVMGDQYTYPDPSVSLRRFSCIVGDNDNTELPGADNEKMLAFCQILKNSLGSD